MGLQLGKYIKNCRQEKKMAVKTLATATGISKSYLDYIESGAREPQVEMLAKIAAVLDLPLATMLDIQKKEQLQSAMTRLQVENASDGGDEVRAVARTGDSSQSLDQKALLALSPIPTKNASGTEMTSAQGHETTRKINER